MYNPRITKFFLYQIRKSTAEINISVTNKIGALPHSMFYCQKNSLYQISHINKGKILPFKTRSKVYMLLDRLHHQKIIAFAMRHINPAIIALTSFIPESNPRPVSQSFHPARPEPLFAISHRISQAFSLRHALLL